MTTASVDRPAQDGDNEHRAQEMLLARIAHDGLPALALILHAAHLGDRAANGMPIGALLRAVPEVGWLTCHDLLQTSGLRGDQRVGDLTRLQRGALAEVLRHAPRPRPPQ